MTVDRYRLNKPVRIILGRDSFTEQRCIAHFLSGRNCIRNQRNRDWNKRTPWKWPPPPAASLVAAKDLTDGLHQEVQTHPEKPQRLHPPQHAHPGAAWALGGTILQCSSHSRAPHRWQWQWGQTPVQPRRFCLASSSTRSYFLPFWRTLLRAPLS